MQILISGLGCKACICFECSVTHVVILVYLPRHIYIGMGTLEVPQHLRFLCETLIIDMLFVVCVQQFQEAEATS